MMQSVCCSVKDMNDLIRGLQRAIIGQGSLDGCLQVKSRASSPWQPRSLLLLLGSLMNLEALQVCTFWIPPLCLCRS